mgnify:FL=1|jgi:hypothetical protein
MSDAAAPTPAPAHAPARAPASCINCGPSKTVSSNSEQAKHFQQCKECMKDLYDDMKCISCGEIQTCRKTFVPTTKRCLKCKCGNCGSLWKWDKECGFVCSGGDCHMFGD